MDTNTYNQLIVNQLTALLDGASQGLGLEHPTTKALNLCLTATVLGHVDTATNDYDEEDERFADEDFDEVEEPREPVLPVGFTQEAYDAFLREQVTTFPGAEVEDIQNGILDVVGLVEQGDGSYVEVGSLNESVDAVNALVEQYEAETETTVQTDNQFTISYTRLNGQELTVADVETILSARASESLKHLGEIQLLDIVDGDDVARKNVNFGILEEGQVRLNTLALGVAQYRGVQTIPGVGAVEAIGHVNFL